LYQPRRQQADNRWRIKTVHRLSIGAQVVERLVTAQSLDITLNWIGMTFARGDGRVGTQDWIRFLPETPRAPRTARVRLGTLAIDRTSQPRCNLRHQALVFQNPYQTLPPNYAVAPVMKITHITARTFL
jgi:hypothetical protein